MNACVFLNLSAATRRRADLEASFASVPHAGWSLERFEALGPADVAAIPGTLTAPEKGCFASHRAAIGRHLDDEAPLLVAEDDVLFSSRAFPVLDVLLAHAPEWDVIFLDVSFCDVALMLQLARRRDEMTTQGEFNVMDLRGRSWAGAACYAIRGASKRKVFDALQAAEELDLGYDLHLRDLANQGVLKIGACFPFLTTMSAEGEPSQIQTDENAVFDLALTAFRRLMFVERDLDHCRADAARLQSVLDGEAASMVGTIFAAMASSAFPMGR